MPPACTVSETISCLLFGVSVLDLQLAESPCLIYREAADECPYSADLKQIGYLNLYCAYKEPGIKLNALDTSKYQCENPDVEEQWLFIIIIYGLLHPMSFVSQSCVAIRKLY